MPYPVAGYPGLETTRPQGGAAALASGKIDVRDLSPNLLAALAMFAASIGKTIDIFSGYRTSAYSASTGGFPNDPHTKGIAVDATVEGKPLGSFSGVSDFGLVSGDQPNFYHGKADPPHVQLAVASQQQSGTKSFLSELISKVPTLDPWVVRTWELEEGGPADNPLNIGPGKHYGTPVAAADATANVLLHSPSSYGYGPIVSAQNVGDQISAIVASKWDATHYAKGGGVKGFDSAFQTLESTYHLGYTGLDRKITPGGSGAGADTGPGDSPGGILGALSSITDAFAFLFSYRFLEILGGGLLVLLGLYILSKQLGVSAPPIPGPAAKVADAV